MCLERQGAGRSRGDGRTDGDVARLRAGGAGEYRDVGGVERGLQRRGADLRVVRCCGVGAATRTADGDVARIEQPLAGLTSGGQGADLNAIHFQGGARGFYLPAIATLASPLGLDAAVRSRHRVGQRNVAPQDHRAALALVGGAGVDGGACFHRHLAGLVQRHGVVKHPALGVLPALPITTDQHLPAARCTGGADAAAPLERDVVTREDDATAHAGEAAGVDAAAVAHHAALQLARGHGAQNQQAAIGLNRLLVLHQRLPLTGLHADVGQLVIRVELQFHHFARSQGHGAFGRHNQALVTHFRGHQGNVAFELGTQFAIVDHAACGTFALKGKVTRHEALVAYAVGGGNQAAHIHHAAAAKEHAVAIADDHLAWRGDAAHDGAGLGASDAVEGGSAGIVEVHLGVLAHIEALPVEDGTLAGLVNDHVGATAADGSAACGQATACGQSVVRHGLGECGGHCCEHAKGQHQSNDQGFSGPRACVDGSACGVGFAAVGLSGLAVLLHALGFAASAHNF